MYGSLSVALSCAVTGPLTQRFFQTVHKCSKNVHKNSAEGPSKSHCGLLSACVLQHWLKKTVM